VLAAIFGSFFGASLAPLIALENLLLLVSFPVSAIGAFYLVRHFTRDTVGALVGGAAFAFNPSHVEHVQHHMHVSSIEFVPFFALFCILANERRSPAYLVLSALCYAISALSSWYYAFYCLYFMIFCHVFAAWRRQPLPARWTLAAVAVHVSVLALLAFPMLEPMIWATTAGAAVNGGGADSYVADLLGYVAFPPLHLLGWLTTGLYRRMTGNEWEQTVYLGLINVALLVWFVVRCRHEQRDLKAFVLCGMLTFAVFASGHWLHLLGHRTLPVPTGILSAVPFVRNVRTPSRAIVFVYLFLAIGIGMAIAAIRQTWPGLRRGDAAVAGLILLMAIDWYPVHLSATPLACSPAYRTIAEDPETGFGLLDLPLGYADQYANHNAAMAYQICHGRPIVGGVVSRELTETLRDTLVLDDPAALRRQLAENSVKYILIHRQDGSLFRWPSQYAGIDRYQAAYEAVYTGPDVIVLRVY